MTSWLKHPLRVVGRLLWFGGELSLAAIDYTLNCGIRSSAAMGSVRAEWLQRFSKRLLKVFKIKLKVCGPLPRTGLLVCNHLSYLDILVLGALTPSVFVAKSEIKAWAVLGWFARLAGTIFVERNRRSEALRTTDEIEVALRNPALVVLFPEGTSSGGATVLPFKSSLLEPATRNVGLLSAGLIAYEASDANVSEEVCYWKDMTLVPHLINLLSKRSIHASVNFSELRQGSTNRKELAQKLYSEVLRLKEAFVA